jgi:hypothetical protein
VGLSVARASWLFGVSVREHRELEAGERLPDFETVDRIDRLSAGRIPALLGVEIYRVD